MHTLFLSSRALQWWNRPGKIRILHLFDSVCNLLNRDDQLLTLALPTVEMGPFSHQIEAEKLATLKMIEADQTLTIKSVSPERFRLEKAPNRPLFEVDLQSATPWEARPAWESYHYSPNSRSQPPFSPNNRFFCAAAKKRVALACPGLISATEALTTAILSKKGADVFPLVDSLAGRGPGLTPLGDDILIGILYGLAVTQQQSTRFTQRLAERAAAQTTTLSAAWLRGAARGEASAPWHAYIEGEPGAINRILQIGATSGSGAWFGFHQLLTQPT